MEEITGTTGDLIKGKSAYLQGSDEPQTGTLELTGNATDGYVYSGKTYYNTDAKAKRTGTMTVGSILSFSAQAYSGRQILLKWQNPYAATGRPFSGVHVWYSTGGYPGAGGGTWLYSGYGGNSTSGGWCQAVATLPNLNTTYYFTACSYATCSAGDLWGTAFNAAATTGGDIWVTFTSSRNYSIAGGYATMDVFCVGGGGGGGNASGGWTKMDGDKYHYVNPGTGGGGGYTVSQQYALNYQAKNANIIIGGGGGPGGNGGASYIAIDGKNVGYANGGKAGGTAGTVSWSAGSMENNFEGRGGNGGSPGGGVMAKYERGTVYAYENGGSDSNTGSHYGASGNWSGAGQGRTTRAWGQSGGTLYSGGGGPGKGENNRASTGPGTGGAGGGANGSNYWDAPGSSAAANTGGGAGGGCAYYYASNDVRSSGGGTGGSGIVLLHLY